MVYFYSSVAHSNETNKITIPRWKQTEIEMDKPAPKAPNNSLLNGSITTNDTTQAVPPPMHGQPHATSKMTFKIPRRPCIPNTTTNNITETPSVSIANRDPRVSRGSGQNAIVPPATVQNIETPRASVQPENINARRISVKDRLGLRGQTNSRKSIDQNPEIIRSNNATASAFTLTSIEQPIAALIGIQNQQPKPLPKQTQLPKIPNVNQSGRRAHSPELPSFVRNGPLARKKLDLKMPSFASKSGSEHAFSLIFKNTCRFYMHNACHTNDCQQEHRLPNHDIFGRSLNNVPQKEVITLYDEFICRNSFLFEFYFADFCNYFGTNSLIEQLKKMVENCNERKLQYNFSKIVDGLMLTGKSYTKALIDVIQAVHCRKIATSKEIIKLILHPRNDNIHPFIDVIDSIAKQATFKFTRECVNRLLAFYVQKNIIELEQIIWTILNSNRNDLVMFDNELLTIFMNQSVENAMESGK